MKLEPRFSWISLKLGLKILNIPKKQKKLYFPRTRNPLFFLSLEPPIFPLLPLPSRSRN